MLKEALTQTREEIRKDMVKKYGAVAVKAMEASMAAVNEALDLKVMNLQTASAFMEILSGKFYLAFRKTSPKNTKNGK